MVPFFTFYFSLIAFRFSLFAFHFSLYKGYAKANPSIITPNFR